jgi:lysophospholipase L1-like esterase
MKACSLKKTKTKYVFLDPKLDLMHRTIFLIASFILISCSPVSKYKSLPEVRSWENDIQKFEQLDKSTSYPENSILFAGSSSIRLWSTLEIDMAPYPVIQRGFGGSNLSDLVVYANRIIDHHPCSAIVLFVANDITGSDQDKSPQEVASLFRNVIKTIRKSHPETPVFWIEITPTASRWKVWPEVQKTNSLIKNICDSQKNLFFIKTDFAFLNENGLPKEELFREDKLHLNEKGYAVWTELIKKELEKIYPLPLRGIPLKGE